MRRRVAIAIVSGLLIIPAGLSVLRSRGSAAVAAEPVKATADPLAQVEQLREEVQKLQGLVPDQAAVMTHVAYHFSNLWFAIDKENWPLADFYLGETRNNVKWAVRAKPIRKTKAGDIDLAGIAQALDNGPFTDMQKAITAKSKAHCVQAYDEALVNCYACHKASEKPYLRPQRPAQPEVPIINFDPNATTPG
ncbi:MAG: hypothetical protein JWL69_2432 [Phycisphaerales bacterium]|nr:hypothetical protein [Phycisphaerales bacterium]